MKVITLDLPAPLSVQQLAEEYARLKNVWKVGELHGIPGSTVHARLVKAGLFTPRQPEFTEDQLARIKQYYADTEPDDFNLQTLADELRKSRANVCRTAKRLGLTIKTRNVAAHTREKFRVIHKGQWQDTPHPRGMLGKKHTPETCKAIGETFKRYWATCKTFNIGRMSPEAREAQSVRSRIMMSNRPASTVYTRSKGGHREDLGGMFFRSSWEANYARYLNMLIRFKAVESWEFEPETFWFEGIKRGVCSYLLDFKVNYVGESKPTYVEIKGWMDPKSKTKIARFRKYFPQHRLEVIGAKEYRALACKWASSIPNWEGAQK